MSVASDFTVGTYLFSDPSWSASTGKSASHMLLNSSVSFSFMPNGAIQTLSAAAVSPGQDVTGLLYTPDLAADDPCVNASAPYVPKNATRQGSLPNTDYNLVALAPWLSPRCVQNYLNAAQQDPVRGFLFFLPNNDTNQPPDAGDSKWDLGDGGNWKTANRYPIFAIPGPTGKLLLEESALYSGNITTVPNGPILSQLGSPTDYVRLLVDINISPSSSLPSLWAFLLIVLGILIVIILTVSGLMHWLQMKRRRSLRRRIAAGEVDLEALGIQRLTVPQEVLDKMPLFDYATGRAVSDSAGRRSAGEKEISRTQLAPTANGEKEQLQSTTSPIITDQAQFQNYRHQTTCAICLDDFPEQRQFECAVRQLPCNHIFHPECVDTFLRENSSLCPLCKSSALPAGYCPKVITNVMVRRERMLRRMRERAENGETTNPSSRPRRGLNGLAFWRRPSSDRDADLQNVELQSQQNGSAQSPTQIPSAPMFDLPADTPRRREWARQRAVAMLGRRAPTMEADANQQSRWKKVLGGVFPGIA